MKNQYQISVRRGANIFGGGEAIATIKRRVYCEQVGNFNRLACRYRGRTFLVYSESGDVGDPFRVDESYATSLFIRSEKPCEWNL